MPLPTRKRLLSKISLKDSTRDQIAGLAKQAKGRVEAAAGELAGSARLKVKGAIDQAEGKAQTRTGAMKKARGR